MDTTALICPVCGHPVEPRGTSLACRSGHSFDLSAKGYANLLLDKHRNSAAPGDSREMVDARRRFLGSGAYSVLREALGTEVRNHAGEIRVLVDAGCGEGTWTTALREALPDEASTVYGMDISKDAIRRAAGKDRRISWVVASLFRLPIRDGTADMLTNVFAPSADAEFARVLRRNGLLVTAVPGKDHLWGLKQVLYEMPRENDEALPELPSFVLEKTVHVEGRLHLTGHENLQDLLSMTPYAWRSPREGIERYGRMETLDTPVSFVLAVHRKR